MRMRIRLITIAVRWRVCDSGDRADRGARPFPSSPPSLTTGPTWSARRSWSTTMSSFYVPRDGEQPDELQLKRTPITFLVPRRLRPPIQPDSTRRSSGACSSVTGQA